MLEIVVSFFTLSLLEILLGIDNIVVLSILVDRLDKKKDRDLARRIGLITSLILRIAFLFTLTWITRMDNPLFTLGGHPISIRDLIFLFGGVFLLYRGVQEMDHMFKDKRKKVQTDSTYTSLPNAKVKSSGLLRVIAEIAFLDVLFAIDSIVTAIALSKHIGVMIAANVFAVLLMMVIVGWVSRFLKKNPAFKVLALSFLMLVGFSLISEGLGLNIPKGYLYFSIGFALMIEIFNTLLRKDKD